MTRRQICLKANRARINKLAETFKKRFWDTVDLHAERGCWNWLGSTKPNGYGEVKKLGKMFTTHRLSFAMLKGPIPKGLCVCHSCDNKRCVNPGHLFLGTHRDNVHDCINKGRRRYHRGPTPKMQGENHPNVKLTENQIRMIRRKDLSRYGEKVKLARQLGVTGPSISQIVRRKSWKHLS